MQNTATYAVKRLKTQYYTRDMYFAPPNTPRHLHLKQKLKVKPKETASQNNFPFSKSYENFLQTKSTDVH